MRCRAVLFQLGGGDSPHPPVERKESEVVKRRKGLLRILVVILALAVVVIAAVIIATEGTILAGGVPLEGVTFTSGDIPDYPAYPGAIQSTESAGVAVPDDMWCLIGTREE